MVEENFGFQLSEMLQNNGFEQVYLLQNIFTMAEENFGFQLSEMLQNKELEQCYYYRIYSPWLRKIKFWISDVLNALK